MSKKTWILITCLVLSLAMGLGGSLAYLTDRDADANVFTMGNVDIELVEKFEQGSELVPGVKINKDAQIKNVGNNDAWVWMTVAVPENLQAGTGINNSTFNPVHINVPGKNWLGYQNNQNYWDADQTAPTPENQCWIVDYTEKEKGYTDANGVEYRVLTHLYNGILPAGETTSIALTQVYMDTHVDITPEGDLYWVDKGVATDLNWNVREQGNPVIYVSAYAIQAEGFETAQEAYAAYNTQWTTDAGVNNGLIWADVVSGTENYKPGVANNANSFQGYDVPENGIVDGVTVIDTSAEGQSLRGLYETALDSNLVIKDSYLDGTYAMNVTATGEGRTLTATNTTFAGWTSYKGFESVTFENCKFMVNSKGTYNMLRAHDATTLVNCELAGTTLSCDAHDGTMGSIKLVNCTYNGVLITSADQVNKDETYAPVITIEND